MLTRFVEGASEISPPRTGGPASIPITRSVEEYPSGHHRIPISSFYARCLSQRGSIDFQGKLFVYRPIRVKLSGIFALSQWGLKVKKIGGEVPPLGGI